MGIVFYKILFLFWYYLVKYLLGEYYIRFKRVYIIVWLFVKFDNFFFF